MSWSGASAASELDPLGRQLPAIRRVLAQLFREEPRVLLRTPRMPAGFGVPHLDERQQRLDHEPFGVGSGDAGALGAALFDAQPDQPEAGDAADETDHRIERRQHDPAIPEQQNRAAPRAGGHQGADAEPGSETKGGRGEADASPGDQRRQHFDRQGVLGAAKEILLEQVVGHRRLHLDAREQRVERRGDDLAGPERRRAQEDHLVLQRVGWQ